MGAFVIAGLILVGTILLSLVTIFADGMSDSPSTQISPVPMFFGGLTLAALVAASHWLPHIGW